MFSLLIPDGTLGSRCALSAGQRSGPYLAQPSGLRLQLRLPTAHVSIKVREESLCSISKHWNRTSQRHLPPSFKALCPMLLVSTK